MAKFNMKETANGFRATNVKGIVLKARYFTGDKTWTLATLQTKSGYYIFETMRESMEEAIAVLEEYFNENEQKIRQNMEKVGA